MPYYKASKIKQKEDDIMSKKDCQQIDEGCNVKVSVDVSKIVKYVSVAAVLIVGIIFGTLTFRKMIEDGFFEVIE